MKGMRIWVMTELLYDEHGNATVLRSFSKPSKQSAVSQASKNKVQKMQTKQSGEVDLF